MSAGQLIREARLKRGLSQRQLARRTGTQQSAISRLEAGEVSPSIHTLRMMLLAMGEHLEISSSDPPREYDLAHRRATAKRARAERLALGISWNRLAGRLAEAGRVARGRA